MPGGLDRLRGVGRLIRAAESTGGTRFVTGVTTADPSGGWIDVDVGVQVVPAKVPGSFRAALAKGQDVRLSVQGTLYTVDSVLSALSTPSVSSTPSSSGVSPGVNSTTSSGAPAGSSVDTVASYTRGLAGDINALRNDTRDIADDLVNLRDTVNDLLDTVADIKSALTDQGHIS